MFVNFFTPPLVEGPKIIFFVPVPEFLGKFPLAMDIGNGHYGLPVTITVVGTWFFMFVLFLLFKIGTKKVEVIPKTWLQTALESLYSFLDSTIEQMIGKWKNKYFSFIATLFIFILTSNLLTFCFPIPWPSFGPNGSVTVGPAFRSPTMDLNTTVGLALVVMILFTWTNIKRNGIIGYSKGFLDPVPVMLPLNIIGEFAKPVNMSMRLFGNMFAGSVIMGLLYKAAPWVIPAPLHLYFDLFSSVVQTFVFTMLTMVHIQGALGDSEPEAEY